MRRWIVLFAAMLAAPPAPIQAAPDECGSDIYRIEMHRNDVLRGSVSQNEGDVAISVIAPNGAKLAHFDFDDQIPERFLVVAPETGQYQLVVEPKQAKGPFCLELTALTRRTDADLLEMSAQSFLSGVMSRIGMASVVDRNLADADAALTLCKAADATECEADALHALAYAHWYAGRDMKLAREYLRECLALRRVAGNHLGEALALNDIAVVSRAMGDLVAARDALEESAPIAERITGRPYALAYHNVASVYLLLGDGQKALDAERRALALMQAVNARHGIALTLTVLGQIELQLGDAEEALKLQRQALPIWREVRQPTGEAEATARIGMAFEAMGRRADALDHYRRALAMTRSLPDPQGTARNLLRLGGVLNALGRYEKARATFQEALQALEASKMDPSDALQGLGDSYAGQRQPARALDFYHRALTTHEANANAAGGVIVRVAIARVEQRRGRLTAAKLQLDGAITQIEASRGRLTDMDSRARYLAARQSAYELSIDVLMSLGRPRAALAMSERARSRSLLDSVSEHAVPATLEAGPIQKLLDPQTVLAEYALGDVRSFVWIVGHDSFAVHELPPRRRIEETARRLAKLLPQTHRREAAVAARVVAQELSDMILPATMPGRRMVIVADGALQYVPFAVLPDGDETLLAQHEIVMLPSMSVAGAMQKTQRTSNRHLAVFADPVLSVTDPRLQNRSARVQVPPDLLRSFRGAGDHFLDRLAYSRLEANAITKLFTDEATLTALDFDASRDTVLRSDLGRFRMIHFATHGLMNAEQPELSGLVLSLVDPNGQPLDGFLRLRDIYGLHLNADLVVLSACRTALGREITREGLLSITRGFLHAGARRVVATLWDVRDSATAELMKRFYAGMLVDKLSPSAALRQAQVSMARQPRWSSPFYWASFTIQGDWK